ncbi:tRNA (adenosine(37)-N6)-dimethylallyltransferase MiaA [Chromatium okenii]|uniref:tRNA (adenosine(37)-N6)-dimethylallyltransferase MiaA n=1 Tax=Chromatium okenii TaxID=61644 RepID=UPI00190834DD|nr:tRNA (adenosine(37)-N6)-dimethylallyltransferase MiaA [Chromatium okenii]MBK1642928.1 tRNA (adenosine(37)-N6)-dimethylallyltransferase MiaA [Chromatium okenii]
MTPPTAFPWAIFLMGPTAAGKTELAVALARRLPCELISVDSALVYRGMDIGTAKPSPALLAEIPHHLIDILDPAVPYSTAQCRHDALAAMVDITARGRIPLLVGGTMLYFRGLQQGLATLPSANPAVRDALSAEAAVIGWSALHARLTALDPVTAAQIHPHDPQRIQRALEVHALTGRPLSALIAAAAAAPLPYRLLKFARAPHDRAVLHTRIAQRFHAMLADGLIDEVRSLLARGDLTPDLPALRCVGYRQVVEYLSGAIDHATLVERGIIASRQLAKRQLTWLRAEPDCHWLADEPEPLNAAMQLIEQTIINAPLPELR